MQILSGLVLYTSNSLISVTVNSFIFIGHIMPFKEGDDLYEGF